MGSRGAAAAMAAGVMAMVSAQSAQAQTLTRPPGENRLLYVGTTSGSDLLNVSSNATTVAYTSGAGSASRTSWGPMPSGCAQDPDTFVVTCSVTTEALHFDLRAGGDTLLSSGPRRIVADGGDQHDTLKGADGDDQLSGGRGTDTIDGGAGADRLDGGADPDSLNFSTREVPITVTLDGVADDGAAGEGDDLVGFETVIGGKAGDLLVAGATGATLQGGPGPDRIVGGAGVDTLFGMDGDDDIEAIGGGADLINCGDGTADGVAPDPADSIDACERFDRDGDQALTPEDCADDDPARRPGATDVAGNGVDEDCDGADAVRPPAPPDGDGDGDGGSGGSGGGTGTSTGTSGTAGTGTGTGGTSGSGTQGVTPPPAPARPRVVPRWSRARGGHTLLRRLEVRGLPAGATVRLRCTGRGCPRAARRTLAAGTGTTLRLDTASLRRARLRPGLRLEVLVRAGAQVLAHERFTTRRARLPRRAVLR